MQPLPSTPKDLLNYVHSLPGTPDWAVKTIQPILGCLRWVNSIILLTLLECLDRGEYPAVTHTILERSGRNISQSQLRQLVQLGYLDCTTARTARKDAHAWVITDQALPVVRRIESQLATLIARANRRITARFELASLTAQFAGADPARIRDQHTLGSQLGIDLTTDGDYLDLIRHHFAIHLHPDELSTLVTFGDLTHLIQQKLNLR